MGKNVDAPKVDTDVDSSVDLSAPAGAIARLRAAFARLREGVDFPEVTFGHLSPGEELPKGYILDRVLGVIDERYDRSE